MPMDGDRTIVLQAVNREIFRRRVVILSRVIALLMVVGIFYVGYIQYKYAFEVNKIKEGIGSLGYCYLCGKEALRTCACVYSDDLGLITSRTNITSLSQSLADGNIASCPIRGGLADNNYDNLFNISVLNITK